MKPFRFQWIIPEVLALSGQPMTKKEYLFITQSEGIEFAINLREYPVQVYFKKYTDWESEFKLQYFNIGTKDETGFTISQFEKMYEIFSMIIEQNKRLLIHCAGGAGRTSTAFIAIMMKHYQLSLKEVNEKYGPMRSLFGGNAIQEKSLMGWQKYLHQ